MATREQLLEAVDARRTDIESWRQVAKVAAEEAAQLRADMGRRALEDPAGAEGLSAELVALESRAEVARAAAAAAEPLLREAQIAVLELDATELDAAAAEALAELTTHQAKTEKLLSQLRRHEGDFISTYAHQDLLYRLDVQWEGSVSFELPKSLVMQRKAQVLELKAAVLRDCVAGVDPEKRLLMLRSPYDGKVFDLSDSELYPPAIWGPEAVLPLPQFQRAIANAESRLTAARAVDVTGLKRGAAAQAGKADALAAHGDRYEPELTEARHHAAALAAEAAAAPRRVEAAERELRALTDGSGDAA